MPSQKEVTIFVPFEYCPDDEDSPSIKGQAEIYGNESTYDVVTLRNEQHIKITDPEVMRAVRSDLLFSQSVYDTLLENLYWEHHAS